MSNISNAREYRKERNPALKATLSVGFAVAIMAVGWAMMTIGSSPTVKGASFMWLPAALQLVVGIWLGPTLGGLAAGLGAYGAGILAYGGWGIVDIIMNPIAGGLANAVLPYYLFKWLNIDPGISNVSKEELKGSWWKALLLTVIVLAAGLLNILFNLPSPWGLVVPMIVLFIGAGVLLGTASKGSRDFYLAILVAVVVSAVSALIGAVGAWVGGKPFAAAMIDPFIGWFAGDTVSAILGVYLLIMFTPRIKDLIGLHGE